MILIKRNQLAIAVSVFLLAQGLVVSLFLLSSADHPQPSSTETSTNVTSSTTSVTSSTSTAWSRTFSYPNAKASGEVCVSVREFAYCIGGVANSIPIPAVYFARGSNTSGINSTGWIQTKPYPIPIAYQSCVPGKAAIYCIGGMTEGESAPINRVFYAEVLPGGGLTDWKNTSSYPIGITQTSCTSSFSFIYCIGGETGSSASLTRGVYFAKQLSNGIGHWQPTYLYPTMIRETSCAVAFASMYCVGGIGFVTWGVRSVIRDLPNVYYSNLSSTGGIVRPWKLSTSFPFTVFSESCVGHGTYLICLGGATSEGLSKVGLSYGAVVSQNGGLAGSWSKEPNYAQPITSTGCVTISNIIVCIGGEAQNGSGWAGTNSVYYSNLESWPSPSTAGYCPSNNVLASRRIAVVQPTFTAGAYTNGPVAASWGFYRFYTDNENAPGPVTSGLNHLRVDVSNVSNLANQGWAQSTGLRSFISSRLLSECGVSYTLVDDQQVDNGSIFLQNGSRAFDSIIIGHEEYVTNREYSQFSSFVALGGQIVDVDANSFFAEVNYSQASHIMTFWRGHGWWFNGTVATKSTFQPFKVPDASLIGAYYCCYYLGIGGNKDPLYVGNLTYSLGGTLNPSDPLGSSLVSDFNGVILNGYFPHEEDSIVNSTLTSRIVLMYTVNNQFQIGPFTHQFGKGRFLDFAVSGSQILPYDLGLDYLIIRSLGWK